MTQNNNQKQNKDKIVMELDPREVNLIKQIREKYRYGEILVECKDGYPFRIGRTTVYERLD